MKSKLLLFSLCAIALGSTLAPAQIGIGNNRDLELTTSIGTGSLTLGSKVYDPGDLFRARLTSPLGGLDGQPVLLAVDLRGRADNSLVLNLPGEPNALGMTSDFFWLTSGLPSVPGFLPGTPQLSPAGFEVAFPMPDLTSLGDVSIWVQGATLDAGAPNTLAFTRTLRHDSTLVNPTMGYSYSSTEFNAGTRLGYALDTGDLNGDGFADVLVGLPGADTNALEESGEARVLLGPDQNTVLSFTAPTPISGAWFGSTMRVANIVGDSSPDLIVAARFETVAGLAQAGAVYVFEGPSFVNVTRIVADVPESNARFGHCITTTDWDNDGAPDLAIGSPKETVSLVSQAGAVHIVYGPGLTTQSLIPNPQPLPGSKFGYALRGGDLDGVGGGDLVVGAPFHDLGVNDETGLTYVFTNQQVLPSTTFSIGVDVHAFLGHALAIADFNNDGAMDFATAAEFEDGAAVDSGAVHIVFGPSFTQTIVVTSPAPLAMAGFGSDIAAGDINSDGFQDLVVGEFWLDKSGMSKVGTAWAMLGPDFGAGVELAVPTVSPNDNIGRRVAVGDTDGDGFADPIVGAPFSSPGGEDTEGAAFLFNQ